MTAIQTKALCSAVSMASAGKSTGVSFDPLGNDDMGYVFVKVYQDSATAVTRPSSSSIVEIHGSLNNTDWAVIARLDMNSAMTDPKDFYATDTALGSNGGYISACAVMQLLPWMRVSYPALANAKITVTVAEA